MLEFFMLFLAVFLNFVAENTRETSAEHEREKQNMHRSCTLNFTRILLFLQIKYMPASAKKKIVIIYMIILVVIFLSRQTYTCEKSLPNPF